MDLLLGSINEFEYIIGVTLDKLNTETFDLDIKIDPNPVNF